MEDLVVSTLQDIANSRGLFAQTNRVVPIQPFGLVAQEVDELQKSFEQNTGGDVQLQVFGVAAQGTVRQPRIGFDVLTRIGGNDPEHLRQQVVVPGFVQKIGKVIANLDTRHEQQPTEDIGPGFLLCRLNRVGKALLVIGVTKHLNGLHGAVKFGSERLNGQLFRIRGKSVARSLEVLERHDNLDDHFGFALFLRRLHEESRHLTQQIGIAVGFLDLM